METDSPLPGDPPPSAAPTRWRSLLLRAASAMLTTKRGRAGSNSSPMSGYHRLNLKLDVREKSHPIPAGGGLSHTEIAFPLRRPCGKQITSRQWELFYRREIQRRFKEGVTVIRSSARASDSTGRFSLPPDHASTDRSSAYSDPSGKVSSDHPLLSGKIRPRDGP